MARGELAAEGRQAVGAFREALENLSDPVPRLFLALAVAEELAGLAGGIPLADLTPFQGLASWTPPDETGRGPGGRWGSRRIDGLETLPRPEAPRESAAASAIAKGDGERIPVFSFRRRGAASGSPDLTVSERRATAPVEELRGGGLRPGSPEAQPPAPGTAGRREEQAPSPGTVVEPSWPALALLDDLSGAALREAARGVDEGPLGLPAGPGAPGLGESGASDAERSRLDRRSPGGAPADVMAGRGWEDPGRPRAAAGLAVPPRRGARRLSSHLPSASAERASERPGPGLATEQETGVGYAPMAPDPMSMGPQAFGGRPAALVGASQGNAVDMLNTWAEGIISSWTRPGAVRQGTTYSKTPPAKDVGSGTGEPLEPAAAGVPKAAAGDGAPRGGSPAARSAGPLTTQHDRLGWEEWGEGTPEAGLEPDARTLASLVNEALVEEATRHGIDLS